ncbi:hypothetical protein [Mycolicibacterium sp.]|uniref:hypothetical protein n=1 Tax=Mycolicibacterium sp. TaxID=2320850 RepID=UPI003D1225A3
MAEQIRPGDTAERRLAGWQRALRWAAWLTFLGLAVWRSDRVSFSGLEWLALAAAVGISIWCMARPMGGPKIELTDPAHVLGTFSSRTSWSLVLFGAALTAGGIAGVGAAAYDVFTGRATVAEVFTDIAVFVEGWFAELIAGGSYDAELEKTRGYALMFLILPGALLLMFNLTPFLKRGREFHVHPDGTVSLRGAAGGEALLEYRYAAVTADGSTIRFIPGPDGPAEVVLPQQRVFARENGARLPRTLSAEFFAQRLASRGFRVVREPDADQFTAHRQ